ncbi:unnamed protein product [Adineta steineri]|uniref:MATH domain-containing protein n=1 Tax=Adineta steineri TaxID=433720 RepID=A0A818QSF3_9BILA|nr:unnamed protein product [Adineta steineri]CAF3643679.1 unnamed protein product [Adineta steineri]
MPPLPTEVLAMQPNDDTLTTITPDCTSHNLYKRPNPVDDEMTYNEGKRGRLTIDNTVPCPLANFGCLSDVSSDGLEKHYSSEIHQECVTKAISSLIKQLHVIPEKLTKSSDDDETISGLLDNLNILSEGVSCIVDDTVQLQQNMTEIRCNLLEQQKQIELLKSSVEESNQFLDATQINNNVLQMEIENMKQMMTDMTNQSANDGTCIWKITDVAQKIKDAISDRQTSIYSPPFYSSPTGYKMCMRLYLNGDGNARRTHLSLFFVLLRGDYDAILQWPFSYKITFCLYDQTDAQRHIIDSFRPDVKSNSFQRPRSSMNIASGIPKFCSLPIIHQDNNPYVRDDCMFIRCMVDFESTVKTMIPFICSINPGLPKNIQRTMCETEMERRKSAESTSQENLPKIDDSK